MAVFSLYTWLYSESCFSAPMFFMRSPQNIRNRILCGDIIVRFRIFVKRDEPVCFPQGVSLHKKGCQANNTDISRIKLGICARRFPKGDAPNRRRKRSESPLVGRWGKAPYPKMPRYLFLEMFGLSLTASHQTAERGTWLGRYATSSSHAPTTSSRSAGKKFGPIRLMWMMDRYRI